MPIELHADDRENFWFAFEGAEHPHGPWYHLRVMEGHGVEELGGHYEISLELSRMSEGGDVDAHALVGKPCCLRMKTGTKPAFRLVHGVIAEAEDVGAGDQRGNRFRVTLAPPVHHASHMHRCTVHVDRVLRKILTETLSTEGRLGLEEWDGSGDLEEDDLKDSYLPARAAYVLRLASSPRVDDETARPYCVQYEETDLDFIGRLIEEEGISAHWVHTPTHAVLVLTDHDGGRRKTNELPMGRGLPGREVSEVRHVGRMRPESVSIRGYNWKKPRLLVHGGDRDEEKDYHTHTWNSRIEESPEHAAAIAKLRKERLDAERRVVEAEARTRLLGAGTIFALDDVSHGHVLVTRVEHEIRNYGSFGGGDGGPIYQARLRGVLAGEDGETRYRPPVHTPGRPRGAGSRKPRIYGIQTAVVTAEPSAGDQEINVGGPEDVGCVRVRFHWDTDDERNRQWPSSKWIRVSQLFAGNAHGAMFSPRVGDEVLVAYIDGDPDAPVIVGRVYNGLNKPAMNPTEDATASWIRTYSSPNDGNYSQLLFEDKQGSEKVELLAAKDFNQVTKNDATISVGKDEHLTVNGKRTIDVAGSESRKIGGSAKIATGDKFRVRAKGSATVYSADAVGLSAEGKAALVLKEEEATLEAQTAVYVLSNGNMTVSSSGNVDVNAGAALRITGGSTVDLRSNGNLNISALGSINITAGAAITIAAPSISFASSGGSATAAGSQAADTLERPAIAGPRRAQMYANDRVRRAQALAARARRPAEERKRALLAEASEELRAKLGPVPERPPALRRGTRWAAPEGFVPPPLPDPDNPPPRPDETIQRADGSEVKVSAEGSFFKQTLPDGTKVTVDTQTGEVAIQTADGVDIQVQPDGSRELTFPDGTRVVQAPDGSFVQSTPGMGDVSVASDGTMSGKTPDGLEVTRTPDGQVTVGAAEEAGEGA